MSADICLILEGTYPYVTGGVSSWVHDLISYLDQFSFHIVTVVPNTSFTREKRYKLPENVLEVQNVYLHEMKIGSMTQVMNKRDRKQFFAGMRQVMDLMVEGTQLDLEQFLSLPGGKPPSIGDVLKSEEGWDFLLDIYRSYFPKAPFVDFFWTFRFVVLPFIRLLQTPVPEARCYHTVCTGYAGFLGAMFRTRQKRPLLLTEHGIYTKERLMEIVDADWIYSEKRDVFDLARELSDLKRLWISMFQGLGRITYDASDRIITLYRGNQLEQLQFGALPQRCSIIPNGIDSGRFTLKRPKASRGPRYSVGFVGRVVPIKDVKTLIRAARLVIDRLPGTEFLILGPTDEEPEYYTECRTLIDILELRELFRFLGPGDVVPFYPGLDLLVLSSISEAQPLVILECHACGVPVVSTDVGAAREMLEGKDKADKSLGPSGIVVPVMDPAALSEAMVTLLIDADRNEAMGRNGSARVDAWYQKTQLMDSYRDLYQEAIAWQA